MEDPKIRFIALIIVNLLVLALLKIWIGSGPESLKNLLDGLPSA